MDRKQKVGVVLESLVEQIMGIAVGMVIVPVMAMASCEFMWDNSDTYFQKIRSILMFPVFLLLVPIVAAKEKWLR